LSESSVDATTAYFLVSSVDLVRWTSEGQVNDRVVEAGKLSRFVWSQETASTAAVVINSGEPPSSNTAVERYYHVTGRRVWSLVGRDHTRTAIFRAMYVAQRRFGSAAPVRALISPSQRPILRIFNKARAMTLHRYPTPPVTPRGGQSGSAFRGTGRSGAQPQLNINFSNLIFVSSSSLRWIYNITLRCQYIWRELSVVLFT